MRSRGMISFDFLPPPLLLGALVSATGAEAATGWAPFFATPLPFAAAAVGFAAALTGAGFSALPFFFAAGAGAATLAGAGFFLLSLVAPKIADRSEASL